MEQKSLFYDDDDEVGADPHDEVISSIAEIRELARDYFNLPDKESPLLEARREQAARANGAHLRGMIAKWAPYETAKGHISVHDPGSGEWHDITYRDAPSWARWEARKRVQLYKGGDRRAYELNSPLMEGIWQEDHAVQDDGIVEEHTDDLE